MNELEKIPTTNVINEWLKTVDWDKFWSNVTDDCKDEIDAYRKASAASYAKSHEHWFI